MPSPYPGIDPEIAKQGRWRGFHNAFLIHAQIALLTVLPAGYDVETDHRLELGPGDDQDDGSDGRWRWGDVDVVRQGDGGSIQPAEGAVATADARTFVRHQPINLAPRQTYARVVAIPDGELVTTIELLSPTNKGSGYMEFLARREVLLNAGINLVELDLLVEGRRLPVVEGINDGDGFAVITLAPTPEQADVWAFTLADRLPRIPVPLKPQDGHVVLDVGKVYTETYDRGGFARRLKYELAPSR